MEDKKEILVENNINDSRENIQNIIFEKLLSIKNIKENTIKEIT